jgi:hypothetical protein
VVGLDGDDVGMRQEYQCRFVGRTLEARHQVGSARRAGLDSSLKAGGAQSVFEDLRGGLFVAGRIRRVGTKQLLEELGGRHRESV